MATYDMGDEAFFSDPAPTFASMRENDPLFWHEQLDAWVLTRYSDVRQLVRDSRFSVDRRQRIRRSSTDSERRILADCYDFMSRWMIFADPPRHTRLRGVIGQAFTPAAARNYEEFVWRTVSTLLDAARRRGSLDVIADLAVPVTSLTNAKLIGLPQEWISDISRWSDAIFRLFNPGAYSSTLAHSAHANLKECQDRMREYLESGSDAEDGSIIATLRTGLDTGSIEDVDEAIASCVMFMVGGHESARHMIGNGVLALLLNRDEMMKLKTSPGLIDKAMDELLRYDSPSVCILRRASENVMINDREIAAGQYVYGALWSANRDPTAFPHPDQLILDRPRQQHLALGLGAHFCVGAPLARIQLSAAVRGLLRINPRLGVAESELRRVPSLASRGLERLPVYVSG
ncbi:hypothetical protein SAMN05216266_111207 [Amycolatopsis marina]|uniref:Cytochrome P450 n=1 Tax=Amycolatopsis marina TaxID=490629 RepID=A0A1I1B3V5_9PSEU|nr:cytochrome P450 [Amycolatopsis marina]SFB44432.1 hypothetical protein SAMN05216266_111207 [Amycolatopsis marina]